MKEKRFIKRFLTMVNVVAMCILLLGVMVSPKMIVKADGTISNPRISEDGTVTWDKVEFGSYYQDADFKVEPIKWRILSISDDGTDAFLLADKALECKPYNTKANKEYVVDGDKYTDYSCTWETSTLRKWLNDTDEGFIKDAFTIEEQNVIKDTRVVNDDNPSYETDGGNDTNDKVYLLSIAEASDEGYGFDNKFEKESKTRQSEVTDYAYCNGATRTNVPDYDGNCSWWLRSPGRVNAYAASVSIDGEGVGVTNFHDGGDSVELVMYAVRPVIHIDLTSSCVVDAGKVTSNGKVILPEQDGYESDGYVAPEKAKGITTWDCVYFGKYKQSAGKDFVKSPIEWRVLSVDEKDVFLMTDKVIDCKPYSEQNDNVTWETSSLREWLNDTTSGFMNDAFTNEEQNAIMTTLVDNDNNPLYGTDGGNNTNDKVYMLSIKEVSDNKYGFNVDNKTRQGSVSDYACLNGESRNANGYGDWWLRTPGDAAFTGMISQVFSDGYISKEGWPGNSLIVGVRPVLHVDLTVVDITVSGTVSTRDKNEVSTSADYKVTFHSDKGYINGFWKAMDDGSFYSASGVIDGTEINTDYSEYIECDSRLGGYPSVGSFENNVVIGWKTDGDDTLYVTDDYYLSENEKYISEYVVRKDVTFNAIWDEAYNITFKTAIGNADIDNIEEYIFQIRKGRRIGSVPALYSDGYVLTGWKIEGTEIIINENDIYEYVPDGDMVFIAVWNDNDTEPSSPVISTYQGTDIKDIGSEGVNESEVQSEKGVVSYESGDNNKPQSDNTEKQDGYAIGEIVADNDSKYIIESEDTVAYEDNDNSKATNVIIPDTVVLNGKEYKVTEIVDGAFSKNTSLKKVTVGNNIETIGEKAFSGCSNLVSISINGNSLKSIETGAFENCKKLSKVILGKNVVSIGKNAFKGDKRLKTITIKSTKIKIIGKNAFKNINNKATIYVPKSLSKKQLVRYKKMLKKAGIPKMGEIKKK